MYLLTPKPLRACRLSDIAPGVGNREALKGIAGVRDNRSEESGRKGATMAGTKEVIQR